MFSFSVATKNTILKLLKNVFFKNASPFSLLLNYFFAYDDQLCSLSINLPIIYRLSDRWFSLESFKKMLINAQNYFPMPKVTDCLFCLTSFTHEMESSES